MKYSGQRTHLKGNSAAVEMFEISEFTHVMEDLLDEIRSDKVSGRQ